MQPINSKYNFKGFKLLKANLSHLKELPVSSFTLFAQKGNYNEKHHIYELLIEVSYSFGDEMNVFLFSTGFIIEDLQWLEIMADQTVVNELFGVAFPFIRERIYNFTSDIRPGFLMPTVDLKNFDITKKVVFNVTKVESKAN